MSSPQLEDGFTCIAHEILEAFCRVNLSPYESRVMWFILRKTYGYRKKADRIPLSQISEATGLEKANASRALRSLKQRRIIALDGKQIGLQKDHEKWLGVSPKTGGVSPETTKRCLQRLQKGVSRDTSKYIKIKDSVKGKPSRSKDSDPRIKELRDTWAALYLDRCGERYHFTGKDFGLFKSALSTFDLPRLKELAAQFFENANSWVKEQAGFTVGVFVSKLNSLASVFNARSNGTAPAELTI